MGNSLPRISVVTPSFNQGAYLDETIRSVRDQDYPNLEYLIIDGGSTDDSVAVIQRYPDCVGYWVSESDGGQADALNKGFARASGELFCYINSDDRLAPGILWRVAEEYLRSGPSPDFWATFPVMDFGPQGEHLQVPPQLLDLPSWVARRAGLHQPGVFWSADLHRRAGGFDASLHYAFDRKLFMDFIALGAPPRVFTEPVAAWFRLHEASKTVRQKGEDKANRNFIDEFQRISAEFLPRLSPTERHWVEDHLRQRRMSRLLARLEASHAGSGERIGQLARFGVREPGALRTRFFWGALRNLLTARFDA